MTVSEVKQSTRADPTLQAVIEALRNNSWHSTFETPSPLVNSQDLHALYNIRDELSVSDDHDLLLRSHRLILPHALRQRALHIAYEGHVPQGSILGPILFLIFINDLPSYVGSSKPFLFADDSTLISSGSDLHELSVSLKSDMTSVSRWTNHNKMSLNPGKTKIMKIYSQSKFPDLSPITIEVNNNNVKEITSAILLGVTLDQHLKWDRQINTIYNIINSRLYLLKRIRSYLTFQSRIQLYYALIYPHLLYCSTVWGNANNDLITCLLKLQKRAARLILEQSTEVPSIVLFRKLNWIPIFNLIKMRKILLVFNTLKTSWPPDLRKLFVFVRDSHPIPTRSSITDLKVPSVKTTQAKSKISFSGASLFNSLPSELKDIENHSIYSYKKKLKTYFIQLNYEVDHINKFRCIDCKHITHCQCYSQ